MKKLLTIMMLSCACAVISAQADSVYKYCKLLGMPAKVIGSKMMIYADSGQTTVFSEKQMKDRLGNPVYFNSDIDAVNYMARQKWELHLVYNLPDNTASTVWVLRKKVKVLR